jgi:hypothetical protein
MHRRSLLLACLVVPALLGCGGDSGPALYEAGGVVTFKGQPLANATVQFIPGETDKGVPSAQGTTNDKGEYRLKVRGQAGAAAGTYSVVVQKFEGADEAAAAAAASNPGQPSTPEEAMKQMAANMKKMQPDSQKAQANQSVTVEKPKSLIPEKYNQPHSSGLSFSVKKGDAGNLKFDIALND